MKNRKIKIIEYAQCFDMPMAIEIAMVIINEIRMFKMFILFSFVTFPLYDLIKCSALLRVPSISSKLMFLLIRPDFSYLILTFLFLNSGL